MTAFGPLAAAPKWLERGGIADIAWRLDTHAEMQGVWTMRRPSIHCALAPVLLMTGGCQEECGRAVPGCNELANYGENSLLEGYFARLKETPHDREFLFYPNADESGLDIIALPRKGHDRGYATVLANSKVPPRDKVMGEPLSQDTLLKIRERTALTDEVDAFLASVANSAETPS